MTNMKETKTVNKKLSNAIKKGMKKASYAMDEAIRKAVEKDPY